MTSTAFGLPIMPGLASRLLKLPHLARPIHLLKRRGYSLSAAASALFDHIAHEKSSLVTLARQPGMD